MPHSSPRLLRRLSPLLGRLQRQPPRRPLRSTGPSSLAGSFAASLAVSFAACLSACGSPSSLPDLPLSGATSVDTAAPERVSAGVPFAIACHFFDEEGEARPLPEGVRADVTASPASALEATPDGLYIATEVGPFTVACSTDAGALEDITPAEVQVTPGPAAYTVIHLDAHSVEAGAGRVRAECEVYDTFGNPIEGAQPRLGVMPRRDAAIDGLEVRFEHADRYTLSCVLAGAEADTEVLTVLPSLPEQLLVSVSPAQSYYARGEQVDVETRVLDRFGNEVLDAEIRYDTAPGSGLRALGAGEFQLDADGTHTVWVSVDSPTYLDQELRASVDLRVSGSGPAVVCDAERYRALEAGEPFRFAGRVADGNGIASVQVNGVEVEVGEDGRFTADIAAEFGLNLVEVVATDGVGAATSRACPVVAAASYAAQQGPLPGVVSALLGPTAIDDGARGGAIDSITDIMQIVLGSTGVEQTAHEALEAAGEILPPSCITHILGICVNATADYGGSFSIGGPNDAAMSLSDGGLAVSLTLRDIRLALDIDVFRFVAINDLEVRLESLSLDMILDAALVGGAPALSVRPGSLVTTHAGTLTADGSWVPGFLLDAVIRWIQSDIRAVIVARLEYYLPSILTEVVTDLFGAIDVDALDVEIVVPSLDGGDPFVLTPTFELAAFDVTQERLRLGIATAIDATPVHSFDDPGIPLPWGELYFDATPEAPMEVAISGAIVNQAVAALWRAGFLELDGAELLGAELPEGYGVDIVGTMPPIARVRDDGSLEVGIGGLEAAIALPGIFGEPLLAQVNAIASTGLTLSGETLSVDDVVIEELHFSMEGIDLDPAQRETLEAALMSVVVTVVESLLTDALPRLPIPSLPLPPSFEVYGLPPATEVGVLDGVMSSQGQHLYLTSEFGVQ